ncbi:hypothetical protein GUITHDRAFT_134070 [Guillardia theta CCMP2712]|uniref:Ionotropic glutamate receptor C-terminal domain-containing protein n=1 Tax=Guillardia theta (strain CCMP2712) TaxID=905079 RepID=L1JUC9_GUITC|nr:hypothetical protein GUITHDRAFT_134070 [Guillardia theta CCMP2712]EKX51698.1 hypothetical protein GUITHDRAFT_134070 [Guillardia theta CCMP2712]|eukprot:XP_005838678.1 hypothetical protein GUITHDRAFT_134070 [Guillardia theta CCMP2712]
MFPLHFISLPLALALLATAAESQVCPTQTVFSSDKGFNNRTFTMALHVAPPFVSYNKEVSGSSRFSGLTIDIANLLENELSCKFEFMLADGNNPESSRAAVQSVVSNAGSSPQAQIAGGALEITTERSSIAHFTIPYYDTGYILIVQRPAQSPSLWHFFGPFQTTLWIAVLVEIVAVALLCYLMESPFLSSIKDSDIVDTANLASFLTASFSVPGISDWSSVLNSKGKFKLALPAGGLHQAFVQFEKKQYPNAVFNVTWTDSWESAVKMVGDGLADATFHDEPIVQDYIVREGLNCKVMETGKIFNVFGYGFAFNYASLDFIPFSQAIVSLKESGEIGQLIKNYQVGTFQTTSTESCAVTSGDNSFSFRDMLGLFLMTSGVIFVGFVINAKEAREQNKYDGEGQLMRNGTGILLSLKSMCETLRDGESARDVDVKSELLAYIDGILDSSRQNGSKPEDEFLRKDCVGDRLLYGKVSLIELDDQTLKQLRMYVDEWL